MAEVTIDWAGNSGANYRYWIVPMGTSLQAKPGNYIFSRETKPGHWAPIYIGQTEDLDIRFDNHHKAACIKFTSRDTQTIPRAWFAKDIIPENSTVKPSNLNTRPLNYRYSFQPLRGGRWSTHFAMQQFWPDFVEVHLRFRYDWKKHRCSTLSLNLNADG